jgi:hypothetical protein
MLRTLAMLYVTAGAVLAGYVWWVTRDLDRSAHLISAWDEVLIAPVGYYTFFRWLCSEEKKA